MDGVHFHSFQPVLRHVLRQNQFQSSLEEGSMKENIMKVGENMISQKINDYCLIM